jgi:hypothetical protein
MKAFAILAALALTGCVTTPAPAGPTAVIGQWANADGLRVKPLAIIEDSRCPKNVVCVWAGRLLVRAEVTGGIWRETRDFELRRPQPIPGGQMTLMEAAPGKLADRPIEPADYRFTFAVTRGP